MKFEWRKQDKEIYMPKTEPIFVRVPNQRFISINGKGDLNTAEFKDKVGALYSLAYEIKSQYKKWCKIREENLYDDYTLFPLEATWSMSDLAKDIDILLKDELVYNLMICIPEFVPYQIVEISMQSLEKKKPSQLLRTVSVIELQETSSVHMLHVGPYEDEDISFKLMDMYCKQNDFKRLTDKHREIYLSNPNRVDSSKLKTVLRYNVIEIE